MKWGLHEPAIALVRVPRTIPSISSQIPWKNKAWQTITRDSPELGIVPQGMRCDRFGNRATPARLLARILDGVSADMVADLIAREEPSLGSIHSPPVAQDLQQLRRKHDIAIDASFALLDSDHHSFAIDIGDFQADSLRDAQPSRVADGQYRAMLAIPHTAQKLQNFFRTQDDRQLLGHLGGRNDFLQAPILMKRDFVKETKSCYGQDDGAWSQLPFIA